MERPSQIKGRASTKKGPPILRNNPISTWFKNRKNQKQQLKEDAAREISNNKAENEIKICNVLDGINFGTSALPAEVLDKKTNPNQPFGDIEFEIIGASQMIRNNTQDYAGLDISAIDNGIFQIANMVEQAINAGNVHTTLAACKGLSIMIGEIRNMIPNIPANLQKGFLESTKEYAEVWVFYISNNTTLDQLEKNLNNRKTLIDKQSTKLEQEGNELAKRLRTDDKFRSQYEAIKEQSFLKDGKNWTPDMLELYKQLVDRRIAESSLRFEMLHYNMDIMKLEAQKGILDNIWTTLRNVPTANDPDLMNKYNDLIQKTLEEATKVDQEFDEFINVMNKLDAQIDQLANSPGNIAVRNVIGDEIDKIVEKAKQQQLEEAGMFNTSNNHGSRIKLYSEEEVQTLLSNQQTQEVETHENVYVNRSRPRNTN